jgi:hypothetical protein
MHTHNIINIDSYNQVLAQSVTITNDADLGRAAQVLKQIKTIKTMVEKSFNPIIDKAHQAHKEAVKQRNEYLVPLDNAEKATKQKISQYTFEQQKIREIELEKERKLLEQQEIERKKKIEEEAVTKILEADAGQVDEILINAELNLLRQEDITKGQIKCMEDYYLNPVIPDNISARKVFKYRIVDANKINQEFLIPNETAIKKIVTTMKKTAEKIVGGIEVFEDNSIISR